MTIFERGTALPRFRLDGPGKVRLLALEPERFAVETDAPASVALATSQKAFSPYWRVFLDGRDVTDIAARGLFVGLEVPRGTHRVEGRFRVPRWELAASGLGVVALAAIIITASRHR
jgi:hypothetical protein